MTAPGPTFHAPLFHPIAEHALLVEFGTLINHDIHAAVMQLDAALATREVPGLRETVPSYASLLIDFDPIETDHCAIEQAVRTCLSHAEMTSEVAPASRKVSVCYDADLAPDLAAVAEATGLKTEDVIAAHLRGDYRVFMYGFAPGYAYLAGVPESIRLPRKATAVRDVAAGSVMIAGPQCLVTTLIMPTGWWVIGRSPTRILTNDPERPFLFDVGDEVSFQRISRSEFDRLDSAGGTA